MNLPEPNEQITRIGLARRIEEASLNAWPAMQQMLIDGWVLRFSRGFTKRSNSIVPLYRSLTDASDATLLDKIRYCENLYAREQLKTVFRLTSIPDSSGQPHTRALDQLLAERGYELVDPCSVMACDNLGQSPSESGGTMLGVALLDIEEWLRCYCQLTGMNEPARSLHGYILKAIAGETGCAVTYQGEEPVGCGMGVVERELVGLFDIFTHPEHRRSGIGRALVNAIMGWGKHRGAHTAYLQVVEDNQPAIDLYKRLSFRHVYGYWYRIAK